LNDQWVIVEIRQEIKNFLNSNENENTIYQNLWGTAKEILRGKFIAKSTHFRKLEIAQMNNLIIYLKLLGKQEQADSKVVDGKNYKN
jgi:hypothetical protein